MQDTDHNFVIAFNGSLSNLVAREQEALHRFAKGYTSPVLLFEGSKLGVAVHLRGARGLSRFEAEQLRKSLLRNTWHVGIAQFWLAAVGHVQTSNMRLRSPSESTS